MRILFAVPLLLLGACQVSKDDNSTTLSFNEDVAANAADDVGNAAENLGSAAENLGDTIANKAEQTADKVENKVDNVDVDVSVNHKDGNHQ